MAIEDPVLQREMFRSRRKDVEEAGIAAVPSDVNEEGYNRRLEEAKALFEQARVQQDPSRFQTLREQDKPGAFRPIQSTATQMPQANIQQQMAQMQAMGFRPVGMANGGYVRGYAPGGEVRPTILPLGMAAPAGNAGDLSQEYDNPNNILTWTDSYMRQLAEEEANKNARDVPLDFRSGSWAETDPDKIYRDLKLKKALMRRQNPDFPAVDEETSAPRERKDSGDFADISSDMDYRKRMREQEEAGIAALPDKRDYAGDREYSRNVAADTEARQQAMPDKRDYAGDRAYDKITSDREQAIASLGPTVGDNPNGIAELLKSRSSDRRFPEGVTNASLKTGESAATPESDGGIKSTAEAQQAKPALSIDQIPEKPETTMEGIKAQRAKERAENINLALIQAGLSIAGGTSPNALANIGQGGMAGIKAFSEAESESRRALRDEQRALRQEALSRDEMAQRMAMSREEMGQRAAIAADERASRERMFAEQEKRLNAQMTFEFGKTETAQKLAQDELELRRMVANNQVSQADADRLQKDLQFTKSLEMDKWKVEQQLAEPSDNMKLYTAIGNGNMKKGLEIVQRASIMDTKAKAAQDILNPMSNATVEEQDKARAYLLSLIGGGTPSGTAGGAVDTNNPLLQ